MGIGVFELVIHCQSLSHSNIKLQSQRCWVSFIDLGFKILSVCELNHETLLILESILSLKISRKSTIFTLPINSPFASISSSRVCKYVHLRLVSHCTMYIDILLVMILLYQLF